MDDNCIKKPILVVGKVKVADIKLVLFPPLIFLKKLSNSADIKLVLFPPLIFLKKLSNSK